MKALDGAPNAISNGKLNVPFTIYVKDPLVHIDTFNENTKYASKMQHRNDNSNDGHNFHIVLPEPDKYFSLFKYKCRDDLKPVPIVRNLTFISPTHDISFFARKTIISFFF